jgi:hypothetical protein
MVLQCKAIELGKEYNAPIEHRINKGTDERSYLQLNFFKAICVRGANGILQSSILHANEEKPQ